MFMLDGPFVGSEAIERGLVRKHELRSLYRNVFPDVYVPRDARLTLPQRARAGWLWSHRQGILAGLTASALHGAKWVDDQAPIELIWPNARPAPGIRASDMRLPAEESSALDGMRITTPARTAFDIARRRPLNAAVANLVQFPMDWPWSSAFERGMRHRAILSETPTPLPPDWGRQLVAHVEAYRASIQG